MVGELPILLWLLLLQPCPEPWADPKSRSTAAFILDTRRIFESRVTGSLFLDHCLMISIHSTTNPPPGSHWGASSNIKYLEALKTKRPLISWLISLLRIGEPYTRSVRETISRLQAQLSVLVNAMSLEV